jgi:hypothetical protein
MYWESLIQASAHGFYSLIFRENCAPQWNASLRKSSFTWDRLSLELMRIASLSHDWAGEGAQAVPLKAVSSTAALLLLAKKATERFPAAQCPMPTLFPSVEGGILFKWLKGNKELKCTIFGDFIEVIRWRSPDRYDSDGIWELPVQAVAEHFEWLLK